MSRGTVQVRHLVALCLLAAAFALANSIAIPDASADHGKKLNPPTLLWKSYPLEQRPSTTEPAGAAVVRKQQASRQTSPQQDEFLSPEVMGAFIALLLASAWILLMRSSLPMRVRSPRREQGPAATLRPAQRASVRRRRRRLRRPQRVREVIPELVREPVPEPDDDLLEALQPKRPSAPEPEPAEVVVVDLGNARTAATRSFLVDEREREAGPPGEDELEREQELRTLVAEVPPVPESSENDARAAEVEWDPPLPSAVSPPLEELRDAADAGSARAASAPPPSVSLREWTCEIALWRSHGKTAFYARAFREDEEVAVAESRFFEAHGEDIPELTDAALRAHSALSDELLQAGWEKVGLGHAWYSDTFRRDSTVADLVASLTPNRVHKRR